MNDKQNNWLSTIKKIGTFENAKVVCPDCAYKYLTRIDIPLEKDCNVFERLIFCESCNIEYSLTMHGKSNYYEYNGNEKLSNIIQVDEIIRRYQISKIMEKNKNK